jgi:hypothetical protein
VPFATLLQSRLTHLTKVDWFVVGRRLGNLTIVTGYIILLNFDVTTGVILRFVANSLILPWALRTKIWDIAGLVSFLMAIELHKLITILFFS